MSTNPILLNAILAMDAYNRGYNSGIVMPGSLPVSGVGSQIGEASFASDFGQADAKAIGFYAAAYTLADGSKVISYRGTDQLTSILPWTEFGSDMWNGYSLAFGGTPGAASKSNLEGQHVLHDRATAARRV